MNNLFDDCLDIGAEVFLVELVFILVGHGDGSLSGRTGVYYRRAECRAAPVAWARLC